MKKNQNCKLLTAENLQKKYSIGEKMA